MVLPLQMPMEEQVLLHIPGLLPEEMHLFANGLAGGTYTVTATDANGCTSSTTISIIEP